MRRFLGMFVLALSANAQPQRIVSTAPSVTEMLYALGLGARVAGVTTFCHYPPEVKTKPRIGTYMQPNLEVILSLRPDLVVVTKNPVNLTEKMRSAGLRAIEVDHDLIDGIYESIRRIGEAAGVPDRARTINADMMKAMSEIARRAAGKRRTRAMFIVGRTPARIESIIAVGKGSYLDELIRVAGGENIFADSVAAYPKVTLEDILARRPEVIIDMGDMAETTGVTEERKRSVVELWKRHPSIPAVRSGRVHAVASDIFVVPGPRAVNAAREFQRMLHP